MLSTILGKLFARCREEKPLFFQTDKHTDSTGEYDVSIYPLQTGHKNGFFNKQKLSK